MEIDTPAPQIANSLFNYTVTALKPGGVVTSLVGNFVDSNTLNLIVGKSTHIELHNSTENGLEAVLDVPIWGKITSMKLLRPKGYDHDLLFVLVERLKFCVLEFDPSTRELVTRAQGDLRDPVGRPSDEGHLVDVDPAQRVIGLHLYDGLLKIVPMMEDGKMKQAFSCRMEELSIIDIAFLAGCAEPTVAVLYRDNKEAKHMKSYEVHTSSFGDLVEGPKGLNQQNLDGGANLLISVPAPIGGVIVVGSDIITYCSASQPPRSAPIRSTVIKSFGRIDPDGSRYLLSDHQGIMYLLVLAHDGSKVAGLKLEVVGRTSAASSLSYLDNGVVFVGSMHGDSQLVRLHAQPPTPADPNNYVELLETYTNLGPIIDFCVVDLDRQGQGQVVTCSGALSDGSLRIVRNGIGINEQATIELDGIKGVWSLRQTSMDVHDKYLVLSFVGETRLLAINQEDELDEAELPGFDANMQTLWCANMANDQLIQVTASGVRLIDCHSRHLVSEWKPSSGGAINVATGSPTQVAVSSGGGNISLLSVSEGSLQECSTLQLGEEVACMDMTPIGDDQERSHFLAVGTWSMELHLYAVGEGNSSLTQRVKEALSVEVIPRSVLLAAFEGVPYLLLGLGDGQLHHWHLDTTTGAISERKKLVLGTKPILLRPFRSGGSNSSSANGGTSGGGRSSSASSITSSVFAASDRPTVIYSTNRKLMFSNLNENEVNHMASFNSASFPDSLALAKENSLTIGTVDEIQKLHVRSVPLHEQPRRIVHQPETRTFGVLTIANFGLEDETNYVRIIGDAGMDIVASMQLNVNEMCQSITSTKLGDDPATYYVVGTSLCLPDEPEPTKGRIMVLLYDDNKLRLVAEKEVRGSVYQVLPFQQGRLLSSCNNVIQLHRWVQRSDGARELQPECKTTINVLALHLAARGDHILVGDLMRSMSLLLYKPEEGALELRASDYNSNWCMAIEMLNDDTYLASEICGNVFVVRKNADATTDEERQKLEVVGEYNLAENINRFRAGSLVMRLPDSELANIPTLLYGSTNGTIGVLASLPPALFEFLSRLQDALRKVIRGVGGLDHADFRAFRSERKVSESRGFVDGDLIESFLDLSAPHAEKVISLMGPSYTLEEVTRRVEELSRLH
uniref:DNA damage-binding protein 1 n=1 Tax=Dunaliella tertiolecta TaxID=3047 RepID=A0A7S3QK85_DUNTE|eukprot:CAMPEP_0202381594 /NCGR_PEP_ID=MMETSP1127-20130417/37041_1 /ASSEMBLY_ACC=CAM_ASM_000462 /TAXON_ID=3047 /ORGANISM="Dunaliella tertiolecta, Strain CCMP1320" /LENGTH=1132 /DNA_ID=CAMNT_0048980607 /DNA_START=19 /DNA_END=3417 /DNA_ORIENTATION=-